MQPIHPGLQAKRRPDRIRVIDATAPADSVQDGLRREVMEIIESGVPSS